MKKLLLLTLIGLLLALSIFIVINGVQIGPLEILGINAIQAKNSELDNKVNEATKLASTNYKQTISSLETNAKSLEKKKQEYDDIALANTENGEQQTKQIQKYEIETLWVKLGNYATSEGAIIKMDLIKGATSTDISKTYNLKFTVNGSYISITDFISDIENDSALGFKIEEFKMSPSSGGSDLQATFTCKDIAIEGVSEITSTPTETENSAGAENNTNETNTNSANNTNSTNSANNTNTNSTNNTNTNSTDTVQ